MGMQIKTAEFAIELATQLRPASPPRAAQESSAIPSLEYWQGASGQRYVHSIFSLVGCPRLPACTYILVRRNANGSREALRIGTVTADAWSLNLAEIRHRAAQLGANEVHAHLIAADTMARTRIARDLQAGQFAELAAEPAPRPDYLC